MSSEPRNTPINREGIVSRALLSLNAKQTTGGGTQFDLGRAYSAFGVEYKRASTSSTNESTSASIQLQGQIGTTGKWHSLGAAITVNNTTAAIARSTNAVPVSRVRFNIASFTTSAGNSTAGGENKIPITAYILPGLTGSS